MTGYNKENVAKIVVAASRLISVANEFDNDPSIVGEHLESLITAVDLLGDDSKILAAVSVLRLNEGSSVTILCDNPDGPPNNAIEVVDEWTGWEPRRFEGSTLLGALLKAIATRNCGGVNPGPECEPPSHQVSNVDLSQGE